MLKDRAGGQPGVVMVSLGPDLYLLMPTVISSHSSMHILLIKDSKFPQGECEWCVFDEQWNTWLGIHGNYAKRWEFQM